ncbi:unnamed protein product [Durusdinium trenchii]|uniref:SAP domain-containing protein n=1 Tax=Durusdinium trenchii TaxID=1381693 RepID=A0ABP0SUI7_9DINO
MLPLEPFECRTALDIQRALTGAASEEVVLSEVDDLDLCMKELLSNADAMTMITSLKLVSLSLGAHHLELLGEVLGGSSDWRPAPVDEGEETEEVQMDLFDDVQDAVQAASPCQEKSLEEDVEVKGQQLKSLQILRCPGPSSDAWSPLWQSLPTSLTELDISENSLSDHAVAALCGALRQRSMRLTYLTLQGNRCKDVQRLADLISRGGVEILDLAENLLNDKSIQQLCEALPSPSCRLVSLRLDDNRRITSSGLSGLFDLLPRTGIRSLALRRTSMCDKGAAALATSLGKCKLSYLDIAGHHFSLPLVQELIAAVEEASGVSSLVLDDAYQQVHWKRCQQLSDILSGGMNAPDEAGKAALKLTAAEKSLKVGKAQESLKDSEAALEIFRSLGADGEGPLPDVLRLVIDGKRMLAVQLQQELTEVQQFAEAEKNNFAQAGNRRGEAAMLISLAEIALSQCSRPYASGPVPPVKPLEEALHMLRDASPGDKKFGDLSGISPARIYVFADPGQYEQYKEGLKSLGINVVKGRRGICNQRNAIMQHFKPGDRIVEMDDDIKALVTSTGSVRSDTDATVVDVPHKNLEGIVDHIWEVADRENCKLWGVYPLPNTYFLSRTYTVGLAKSTGQMQGYYNPGDLLLTLPVMEDYERVLHFYSRGMHCLRCDYLSVKSENKARGGCDSAFTDYILEETAKGKVFRHPREAAESAAVKNLQARFPSLVVKNLSGPKPVEKKVPVHGQVQYYPPGWRIQLRKQGGTSYISAMDVSSTFAAQLGLGSNVKPMETVVNGNIIDLKRDPRPEVEGGEDTEKEATDSESTDRAIDLWILKQLEVQELRDLCQEAGLKDGGTRKQLIKRLVNPEDTQKPRAKRRRASQSPKGEVGNEATSRRDLESFNDQEELDRLEAFLAAREATEAQEANERAERERAERQRAESERAESERAERERAEEEARNKEREVAQRLQASHAMQALLQVEAARETQRILDRQAEQIVEAGRAAMTGRPDPTSPAARIWQPPPSFRQLRHLMPRFHPPSSHEPRRLHPWIGKLSDEAP